MTSCRSCRGWIVEELYGGLGEGDRERLGTHLAGCPRCATLRDELKATRGLLDRAAGPEARPETLELLWQRLAPRLDDVDRQTTTWPSLDWVRPRLAVAAALAAAVVVATWFGLRPTPPVEHPQEVASGRPASIDDEIDTYLDHASPLLLAIANRDPMLPVSETSDMEAERRLALDLGAEAARLREQLEGPGRRRDAALLTALEILFLQLANLPEVQYQDGLEAVQRAMVGQAILFQISVQEMARNGEQT